MSLPEWIVMIREVLHGTGRSNVIQPILWACAVLSTPCLGMAVRAQGWIQIALVAFAAIPASLLAISYLYFMFTNPDRLQSERFQSQARALDLIESKGGRVSVSASDILNITNPSRPLIVDHTREDGNG